jgi:phosphopantetheinyl transferase
VIRLWLERVASETIASRDERHRWLLAHLGDALGVRPDDLALSATASGAPVLREPACAISFSHHHDWLAAAVSDAQPIGLDVLTVPATTDFLPDTASVLSSEEIAYVRSFAREHRGSAFATTWTRKEAYAKLRQTGLTADLPRMTLTPATTEPVAFWSDRVAGCFVTVATLGTHAPHVKTHYSTGLVARGVSAYRQRGSGSAGELSSTAWRGGVRWKTS